MIDNAQSELPLFAKKARAPSVTQRERDALIDLLHRHGRMKRAEIATMLGWDERRVRAVAAKMTTGRPRILRAPGYQGFILSTHPDAARIWKKEMEPRWRKTIESMQAQRASLENAAHGE